MKKIMMLFLAAMLVIALAGCGSTVEKNASQTGDNTDLTFIQDDMAAAAQSTDMSASSEAYVECAYVGQIDNDTIEVMLDDGAVVFCLTDTAGEQIASLETGDMIGIDYHEQEDGQKVAVSLSQKSMTVIYEGQIDPHSIETYKDGEPIVFQLSADALEQVETLSRGDVVKVVYSENEQGQRVASELIKIEK